MDLGIMTKKLRALGYSDRNQFLMDLELIHSNCYTYNSDPVQSSNWFAHDQLLLGESLSEPCKSLERKMDGTLYLHSRHCDWNGQWQWDGRPRFAFKCPPRQAG